jgi:hypothetical protein
MQTGFAQGHPSSLISPDWPGATRIALEEEFGGVCVFVLGACGETMPIEGHQGNPFVTERQGRQVGLAACAALSSLPSEGGVQLQYSGPIISGAVIGQWSPAPFSAEAVAAAAAFRSKEIEVSVPMRPMQSVASAAATLKEAEARLEAAKVTPHTRSRQFRRCCQSLCPFSPSICRFHVRVHDWWHAGEQAAGSATEEAKELALTEQARRNYRKVADWQENGGVVYKIVVWQLGDIFVVAVPGEPYSELQVGSSTNKPSAIILIPYTAACIVRRPRHRL